MRPFSWLRERIGAIGLAQRATSRRSKRRVAPRARLRVEALEDRYVPSTFAVTTSSDNVNDRQTLRYAVANAQSGDTILLTAAIKNPIVLTNGELLLTQQNLTIESVPVARGVTISGDSLSRIFEVAPGASVSLSNVTITGGNGVAGNPAGNISQDGHGGGILVDAGATLTINESTLSGNSAPYGGGMENDGTLTVQQDSILASNSATQYGGGIYGTPGSTMTVSGSTLTGNFGPFYGGGICSFGTVTVSGTIVTGNSALYAGGGLYDNGTMTVAGCTIACNSATYNGGGINNSGTLTVSDSFLFANSATYGGGIGNGSGTTTVSDSFLFANSAAYGGGIYNVYGTVALSDSTLSRNSATVAGGGIFNTSPWTVTVSGSSSITGNTATAGFGADVYNLGVLYLDSSSTIGILDGNPAVPI